MHLPIVLSSLLDVVGTGLKRYFNFIFSLPPGLGAIFLRLAPETKSSPDKQANVILSSHCASGL
jgi:hypothetical protein